jgi:DNA-binding NtrC family response regulator
VTSETIKAAGAAPAGMADVYLETASRELDQLRSACARFAHVIEARDAGVNEFIAKPVAGMCLFRCVQETIERPRQFAKTTDYFGPDRRRRSGEDYHGEKRRKRELTSTARSPSQSEIDCVIVGETIDEE